MAGAGAAGMGECVFVTGGSSGIGLAVARLAVREGARVALFARDEVRLAAAVAELGAVAGAGDVRGFPADVADPVALGRAVAEAVAVLGPPDRLILSAGVIRQGEVLAMDLGDHRRMIDVNLFGCLNMVAVCAPVMRAGAAVGIVGSAAGLVGIYGQGGYAASKFALRGLAEALRVELAAQGVSVTLCLPPDTDTPMLAAELRDRHPVTAAIAGGGRPMAAEAVARALLRGMARRRFLVLPRADLWLLHLFAPLLVPLLRIRQERALRRLRGGRR